jgi:hypothetical protein
MADVLTHDLLNVHVIKPALRNNLVVSRHVVGRRVVSTSWWLPQVEAPGRHLRPQGVRLTWRAFVVTSHLATVPVS